MAENQLRIDGLAALREALKRLPADLVAEASVIVHAQAEYALREIWDRYPSKSGTLRHGLVLELHSSNVATSAVVKNRAHHAWLYDKGSAARHWKNGKSTGTMPAGGVFISTAIQRRRIMLAALIDLIEHQGLHVSGASA